MANQSSTAIEIKIRPVQDNERLRKGEKSITSQKIRLAYTQNPLELPSGCWQNAAHNNEPENYDTLVGRTLQHTADLIRNAPYITNLEITIRTNTSEGVR